MLAESWSDSSELIVATAINSEPGLQPYDDLSAPNRLEIIVTMVWFGGGVFLIGWCVCRYLALVGKLPLGKPVASDTWLSEWNSLRSDWQLSDSTQLRISEKTGPLVCFVPFFCYFFSLFNYS